MNLAGLPGILERASADHTHLCPRLVLGARLGLAGLAALDQTGSRIDKGILLLAETDGCFLDGLSAATGCTPGHRTLRVEDYGKTAAVFVEVATDRALRVAPVLDLRARAGAYAGDETRPYWAQMQAYQVMPSQAMFTVTAVRLRVPAAAIVSRPRVRTACAACGEEIINERTLLLDGARVCRSCAQGGYYLPLPAGRFA